MLATILQELSEAALPGVSTKDLDDIARNRIKKYQVLPSFLGYGSPPFPAVLCTSINDEVVHGIPNSHRILETGDILKIDCGILHKGLHTDSCITVFVGNPVDHQKTFFIITMKKALYAAIDTVKDGVRLGDISHAMQTVVEHAGFSVVRDCTGHGVGRKLHEPPQIPNYGKRGTGPVLKSGMVLAIEPIGNMGRSEIKTLPDNWTLSTRDGSLSAQWEHTILVTHEKAEILTTL